MSDQLNATEFNPSKDEQDDIAPQGPAANLDDTDDNNNDDTNTADTNTADTNTADTNIDSEATGDIAATGNTDNIENTNDTDDDGDTDVDGDAGDSDDDEGENASDGPGGGRSRPEGPAEYVQREKSGRGRRIGGDVRPDDVDYKNIPLLSRFLDRRGRILSRRKTRVSAKVQRRIVQAIKRARHLALLPYTAEQTRIVRSKRR